MVLPRHLPTNSNTNCLKNNYEPKSCHHISLVSSRSGASDTTAITVDASQGVTFAGTVSGVIKSGTATASTSGTSIDFTGIPATAKRITVLFNGVSSNGTASFTVQIGSGSVDTTGYVAGSTYILNASTITNVGSTTYTTGFGLNTVGSAATTLSGAMVLYQVDTNAWVASGSFNATNTGATTITNGRKTTSGALDRVRISANSDTFDAGSINILWE